MKPKKILAYRFSALGDVVMAYPVLRAVIDANLDIEITFATRKRFAILFQDIPRLKVVGLDLDQEFNGFTGLLKLFWNLKKSKPDAIADLHLILRTRVLDLLFSLFFFKVRSIHKDRKGKRKLIRKENKSLEELEHSTKRYLKVFQRLGLNVPMELPKICFEITAEHEQKIYETLSQKKIEKDGKSWIGIAPFAQHENKIWGLEKTKKLIGLFLENGHHEIFLFGGGKKEKEQLDALCQSFPVRVHNMTGLFSLIEEIALMKRMDKFLAMDSANMHLACLSGTKVFSIWGATHPNAGFSPLYQAKNQIISTSLSCRPCSVFGDKPCFRGDKACMETLQPEIVWQVMK